MRGKIKKLIKETSKTNVMALMLIVFSTLMFILSTVWFSVLTKKATNDATNALGEFYLEEIAERIENEISLELKGKKQQIRNGVEVAQLVDANFLQSENNQVYCRLFDRNGDCLLGLEETTRDKENVFDACRQYGSFPKNHSLERMREDWEQGRAGYVVYRAPECMTYFYYQPVEGTDWILGVRLRHSIIERQIASSTGRIFWGSRVQLAVVVFFMVIIFIIMSRLTYKDKIHKHQKKKEQMMLLQQNATSKEKLLLQERLLKEEKHANQVKTRFLSNMSHDIRTPMNAIIGYTDLAITRIDDKDKVLDYLDKIRTASNHLLSLINDILDMSRIESGHVQIQEVECSLLDMMQDIRDILYTDVKNKGLEFLIDTMGVEHEFVYCDRLRMEQILLNCLSNSIKFTPKGGCVRVSVLEIPYQRAGYVRYQLRIKDTGIGMSQDFLEYIFEPFERERTSTVSGIQGTGLGMAIAKNLVELMGGEIEVQSEEGKGTEFIIELEFRLALKKSEGASVKPMVSGKKKILLVEDNELNMEIAKEILEDEGFFIETAENGQLAVDMIRDREAEAFDLVLMDVQMPVMDGYEATRQIRILADPRKANLPIVAMTANAFEEDKRNAFAAGMNEHVAKPLDLERLLEVIEEVT